LNAARHRWLLVALVFTWAISWPVIKVGVAHVPPLWFATLRYAIAACCLFAFVGLRGELRTPPRGDWPLIAVSAVLQLGAYSALTGMALTVLPPGRASVLAFSTPIWVVPISAVWLRERLSRAGMLGVGLGLLGALAIAAPSLNRAGSGHGLAYALLMAAAAAWAVSIVYVRKHRFIASALALAPWQMLLAAGLLLPCALALEGLLQEVGVEGTASLAYVGPVATAFAYWAVVEAGRRFRASTMSMALLATPSLGIAISAWAQHEPIGASLIAGVIMIAAGIRLATAAPAHSRDPAPATEVPAGAANGAKAPQRCA
jgi:drug/metabolite transporter (DMT)-like permease